MRGLLRVALNNCLSSLNYYYAIVKKSNIKVFVSFCFITMSGYTLYSIHCNITCNITFDSRIYTTSSIIIIEMYFLSFSRCLYSKLDNKHIEFMLLLVRINMLVTLRNSTIVIIYAWGY